MIAASDSTGKVPARTASRASDKDADNSPFAILLVETAQQPLQKQPATRTDKSDAPSKPPVEAADARTNAEQTNAVPATQTASSAPDSKRDKKYDADNSDTAGDTDTPQAQAPVPATLVLAAVIPPVPLAVPQAPSQTPDPATPVPVDVLPPIPQANPQALNQTPASGNSAPATSAAATPVPVGVIPPVAQTNPQAPGMTPAAPDSDSGQASSTDSGAPKIDPGAPRAAAQPVNDNLATVQTPPTAAVVSNTVSNNSDTANTLPPHAMAAVSPSRSDSKLVTDKAAKPTSDQPRLADNQGPAPAADATAMTQAAMTAPPTANVSSPDASDTATATQITGIAAAATDKSDTGKTAPAGKPPQPADTTGTPAIAPTPASLPATAASAGTAQGDIAKSSGSIKSNSDAKPARTADVQPQPDIPVPSPLSVPVPPQHIAANSFGMVPPAAATADNAMVTTSVQITSANAEPTPDLDALAVSIAARAMSGTKQFEIRLDPPELGRVDVRLSIDASGKTQAHMTADQPQTLDLLQKDATNLTQALRDAGLDVSQGGLNFSLRGQDRQSDDGNNGAAQGRRTNLIATRAIQASPVAVSFNGAAQDARVDIHV